MKKLPFPVITFVLFLCVACAAAQDNSCPSLNIVSPDHVLPKGERGTYMANMDAKGKSLTLEYLWSASSRGRDGDQDLEFDGQATSQITVVFPDRGSSVFVTLKVKGLPEGCPSEASDAIIVDLAPEAAKLFDVKPGDVISKRDIEAAASRLNDHPNDALFILSGHVNGKSSELSTTREAEIIRRLTDAGLSRDRITLQNVNANRELIQLWVVPPGATPPYRLDETPKTGIDGKIVSGKPIYLAKPVFPPSGCRCKIPRSSKTIVEFVVSKNGRVVSTKAVTGHPFLRPASEVVIRQSTFEVSTVDHKPSISDGKITYEFVLSRGPWVARIVDYELNPRTNKYCNQQIPFLR